MRLHHALLAAAVVGAFATVASSADARRFMRSHDAYGLNGSYYSYGADRANPSLSPRGMDQNNPRDQQLQGHN